MRRRGDIYWLLDGAVAALLLLALGVVFGIDYFRQPVRSPPLAGLNELHAVERSANVESTPTKGNRIGVTPTRNGNIRVYDDVGKLLDGLGKGYSYTAFDLNGLREFEKIANFSVIFLTCSTFPQEWLGQRIGAGVRPGTEGFTRNEHVFDEAKKAIRTWVERGGTLYVSDLHFGLMSEVFPEMIDRDSIDDGAKQTVTAEVLDEGLRDRIGSKIELTFDQPNWKPAAFLVSKSSILLRGEYESVSGNRRTAPLLVKFPVSKGSVIFTSFHNEKQNSKNERSLLEYLVFTTVTSRMQAQIQKTMQFASQKSNLITASADTPIATQTYHKEKPGRMQVALGFENQEATLRLKIVAPNGKQYSKDVASSVVLDIADSDAVVGDWTLTVEALKIPYPNFPFNLIVGQE